MPRRTVSLRAEKIAYRASIHKSLIVISDHNISIKNFEYD